MADNIRYKTLDAPYRDEIANELGLFSLSWQTFFQMLVEIVSPISTERSCDIANNQISAIDISGFSFNKKYVSYACIELYVQRTTSTSSKVGAAIAQVYYNPKTDAWAFVSAPTVGGVTFSITTLGQIQYTSDSISGTAAISKVTWRTHTMAAKHSSYSKAGN